MIILVGASASGKTEVAKMLGKLFKMQKVITHTTRPMRVGEINGIDYHFVTVDEFKQLEENNTFVETTLYNRNYYGTSKSELGDNKVLIVDPNGLDSFKSLNNDRIIAFFMQASRDVRKRRMLERGDDPQIALQRIITDDVKFNPKKIKIFDFIVDSETQSIRDVALEVYERYAESLIKLD